MDIDTKLGLGLCGLVLAATAGLGLVRPEYKEPVKVKLEQRIVEKIDSKFSDEEKRYISDSIENIKGKYELPFDIYFLKSKMIEDTMTTGRTFPMLGNDKESKEDFINIFGKEKYSLLKGKDVIVLREIDKWKELDGEVGMWSSKYMPNDYRKLFFKGIVHEIFHVYGHRIIDDDIEIKVVKIDIDSKAYDKDGKNHPAHPSYYTYFWCGCPDALAEGKHEKKLRELNANETFADAMALKALKYIDDHIEDKELVKKLEIYQKAMKRYEK